MPTGKLHIVPLGGMGEFGMNCMAIRYGDDIVVVDAGLMFPEAELLGVDIVVPDISYLLENRKHVRGIVLTHGHEDHIGALPWVLSELNVPVWATEFTLAYVEDKLDEHQLLDDADLREIVPENASRSARSPFIPYRSRIAWSIASRSPFTRLSAWCCIPAISKSIRLPPTIAVRSARLRRVRQRRSAGAPAGFHQRRAQGLHARANAPCAASSKKCLPAPSALFISCFSSSIHRIKLTVDMAREHGRKICFIGRSMNNSSEIAEDLGYIQIPDGLLIHPGEMKNSRRKKSAC
jgi:ribonuclease J